MTLETFVAVASNHRLEKHVGVTESEICHLLRSHFLALFGQSWSGHTTMVKLVILAVFQTQIPDRKPRASENEVVFVFLRKKGKENFWRSSTNNPDHHVECRGLAFLDEWHYQENPHKIWIVELGWLLGKVMGVVRRGFGKLLHSA